MLTRACRLTTFRRSPLTRCAAPSVRARNKRLSNVRSTTRQVSVTRAVASSAPHRTDMFCFQCEQTSEGKGCTTIGVCGKTAEVAGLQDLLIHAMKGISMYLNRARALGARDLEIENWMLDAMFATLTNVNFDDARFVEYLNTAERYLDKAKALYFEACKRKGATPEKLDGPANFKLNSKTDGEILALQAKEYGIPQRKAKYGDDVVGLQELITYGLKGLCAYAAHAGELGRRDEVVSAFVVEALDFLTKENVDPMDYLKFSLRVGEVNLRVMKMLDEGHTTTYGHPVPTKVPTSPIKGKAILVSGHDLRDLELILKQTEGKGINVYTHGEMLPAHGYPKLKQYKHLIGNYGGAWQLQKFDFSLFPGAIVMTTNCITEPAKKYKGRIFTRHTVGWPGVKHIPGDDFSEVVKAALELPGFTGDEGPADKFVTTGFARNTVTSVAPQIVQAVKNGDIKHFFLIGGCDGAELERSYFTDVAKETPKDSVILTLACGKYRINSLQLGEVAGFPRILDMGQCNDAYSAIQVALALSKAFDTNVNDLPLSFVISWFEQKAVAVLLTLLYLDVKNIYLGPRLPAFVTPNVFNILVSTFGLRKIGNAKEDVKKMLAKKPAAAAEM